METKCALIKLKPGSKERVKQWKQYMLENKEEALQSIRNEGVIIESAFYTEIKANSYLVYYMKVEDVGKSQQVARESTLAVDAYHKQLKKDSQTGVLKYLLLN